MLTREVELLKQKYYECKATTDIGEVSLADSSFGLSRRALNVLGRIKCNTLSDLKRFGIENVRNVYGCGTNTYLELKRLL